MYFILSVIVTGLIGYFLPQLMYEITWQDLINFTKKDTLTNEATEFLKFLGITDKSISEVAQEKLITIIAIIVAIFIGMLIITNILKKLANKGK